MSTLRPRECPGLSLADVRTCVEGLRLVPVDAGGVRVTGVTLDSRDVRPGDLYAALPGANVHGARFVADAVSAGAVAVLTDPVGQGIVAEQADAGGSVPIMVAADARAVLGEVAAAVYDHPSRSLVLLGVTGTNGKTTVAHLVEQGLRSLGRVTGLVGTIETSVAGSRMKSVRTTPESPDLHALFAVMRQEQVRACVMEVSSHALQLHRVDGVVYDVAAFTNLSQDHLDFHHTMEEYYQAKARLFTPQRARCGVVVVDDEWGRRLAADAEVPVVTLTSDPGTPADWHLLPADSAGRSSPDPGSHADWFRLRGRGRSLRLRAALPGRHNRTNTAVAALMLLTAGESVEVVQLAFSREMTVPGRMERVDLGAGAPLVYVDFAHTPQAVT